MDKFGERMGDMEKAAQSPPSRATSGEANGIGGTEQNEMNGEIQHQRRADPAPLDIPSVRQLRRDYDVEREVNRRLAELDIEDGDMEPPRTATHRARGKRSGAARTVQDKVVRDIDWPHFHIYTPPGAEPMTFLALSIPEFTYGFLHMIDQPDANFDRRVMWDLLKAVMEDAVEYPWENVKNFFWILGSHVENDRLQWGDVEQIAKLRAKHAQKYEVVKPKPAISAPTAGKIRYCGPYQTGACTESGDHAGQRHVCGHCYRVKAATYPHPESECRRKALAEQPKNGRGGE